VQLFHRSAPAVGRHLLRKAMLGVMAGLASYLLLLWLHNPWDEILAAASIGSVIGVADGSGKRALTGSIACAAGWLLGSLLFNFWIELGTGAWIVAGAFLAASSAQKRKWWVIVPALLLGSIAGLLAELARYLTLLSPRLRGFDMELLLLLAAGLLLNVVAAVFAPPLGAVHHAPKTVSDVHSAVGL